jgi:integrase
MKGGREHRVPLSPAALAVLREAQRLRLNDYVFPGQKPGRPLSSMALLMLLRRLERGDVTAHGFRSAFSDWAHEETRHPNHVIEMALAHAIGSKVEAAYRRGHLFEKRRALMNDWAAYCSSASEAASGPLMALPSGISA